MSSTKDRSKSSRRCRRGCKGAPANRKIPIRPKVLPGPLGPLLASAAGPATKANDPQDRSPCATDWSASMPSPKSISSKQMCADASPLWERVGVRGYGLSIGRNPSPGSHLTMRSDLSHEGRGDFVASLFAMTAKLLRRGADRRTTGRPVQECDRCKCAKPRTERREGDINPVFRIADDSVRREQIPYAAPCRRRHTPARHHGRGEHHIDRIGCGSRKQNAPGGQRIDGSHCNSLHGKAALN